MTTRGDITIRQGRDYYRGFTVTDEDGVAINLTGAALTFAVREYMGALALTASMALDTPLDGTAHVALTDTQTATLDARRVYRYNVLIVDATALETVPIEGTCYCAEDFGP
jgi:hypothetical protein